MAQRAINQLIDEAYEFIQNLGLSPLPKDKVAVSALRVTDEQWATRPDLKPFSEGAHEGYFSRSNDNGHASLVRNGGLYAPL